MSSTPSPPHFRHFLHNPTSSPLLLLLLSFLLFKSLLLLLALLAPGPGYDTSTSLLHAAPSHPHPRNTTSLLVGNLLPKLLRWDAIYFSEIARRGYVYEQEWAFGWGFTRLLAAMASGLRSAGLVHGAYATAVAGVLLAHACHLGSVLVLWRLSRLLLLSLLTGVGKRAGAEGERMALVAAGLHIFAPAGMFLSAPYAEALFSLLSFWGLGLYAESVLERGSEGGLKGGSWWADGKLVGAGVVLGVAAMVRGNGLLSGLVFAVDAAERVGGLWRSQRLGEGLWGLGLTVVAGGFVGVGLLLPQCLAWWEYCGGGDEGELLRPWCGRRVPSIYAWVQSHYWDVGLFRYWTISNLPLFVLAAPMLYIMTTSALWGLTGSSGSLMVEYGKKDTKTEPSDPKTTVLGKKDAKIERSDSKTMESLAERARHVILRLAIPQLVLAVMAMTSYHVQIITRLSSSYPVWYWWLASTMSENKETVVFGRKWRLARVISRWMVVYVIVQGGLFVSFLPPA